MYGSFSAYNKSIVFALVGATFGSAFVLSHVTPKAKAEEASVSTATVTVTESCSMTGTTNPPHSADLVNGTYSGTNYPSGIGQTTLKAFCNDNSGFAIYAIGYTNNEYGNTKLHWSGATNPSDTTNAINTGIYSSGTTTDSTWSMKLTSVSGTYAPTIADGTNDTENFTTWHIVPQEYTKVAYRTAGTDIDNSGTGIGSSLTTTYDAYISNTQPAGTYIGQVKYTLVHPSTAAAPMAPLNPNIAQSNMIIYAPNASDVQGSMNSLGTTTALTNASPNAGKVSATPNSTANLIAPNFYREGYGFAGWSTDFEATSTSTIYGPNETISTNPNDAGGLDVTSGAILYPVWIASAGNLQSWNGCSSLTTAPSDGTRATLSSMTALTDTRDGNVYTVARLADGQCWMVENLRLNNEYTTSAENIAKAQGYGNATTSANAGNNNLGSFVGLPASEDTNFSNSTTANSLYSIDGSNGTTNIYNGYNVGYRFPRYNNNNTNMAINATNSDGTTTIEDSYNTNNNHVRWYSYGNYYTWSAAIADTNYYTQNNASVTSTSICPTGWRLPEGGMAYAEGNTSGVNVTGDTSTYRDFYNLGYILVGTTAYENTPNSGYSYYNGSNYSNLFRAFPNNFIYSGYWRGSSASSRGGYGGYWSSSAYGSGDAYRLTFSSSSVRPGTNGNYKYYGFSVRCVAGESGS